MYGPKKYCTAAKKRQALGDTMTDPWHRRSYKHCSYICPIFFLRHFFLHHLSGSYALSGSSGSNAPSGAGLADQNLTEQLHLHNAQENTVRCYQEGVLLVVEGEKKAF
jgi:hypothetical protein